MFSSRDNGLLEEELDSLRMRVDNLVDEVRPMEQWVVQIP